MTATRAVLERRPAARSDAARVRRRADGGRIPRVDVEIHQLDGVSVQAPPHETAGVLLDAALGEPAHPLPYASALERQFGQPLDWVQVRSGPLVTYALDRLGARAATRGANVFLRERAAPLDVVAHEVTHVLQAARGRGSVSGVVDEHAPSEVEATQALRSPVRPAEGLSPGAIALLRQGPRPSGDPDITVGPPTTSRETPDGSREARIGAEPTPAPIPSVATATETPAANTPSGQPVADAEPAGEAFALPPIPELAVSREQVAAREAALAEAVAGLAQAGSAGEVLHAYADAPPTVKAQEAASLSSRLSTVLPAETQEFQAAVPTIDADLEGAAGPPPESLRVEAPPAAEVELEPDPVAPAPDPDVPEVPEPAPFTANDSVGGLFSRLTEPPPEQLADAIGDSLSQVETTDPSVPRSPGPPPDIPLGGETDPARIARQEASGREQAAGARDAAARAVVDGPGPEQVQPTTVHEAYGIDVVEPPAAAALTVPEGPDGYLALALPPEVQITFDEQQQASMAESMATATAHADEATTARDNARDQAVSTAEDSAAELNRTAQGKQTAAVTDARTAIQTERQSAVDAQRVEVERVESEAADRRRVDEGTIDTQVQAEQKTIDDSYVDGEKDIADKVAEGERDAQAKREQAERDAENDSWWDKAVSFVKDAFDALVSAIGDIFDRVRAAVNEALDALKDFALSVIDRVAAFVKDAIEGFGEFLKLAVDALIGDIFPELAAELTAAIDTAVTTATAAVDAVADDLKAGVSALVEGLRTAINAALDAYEAAINFAVSVVGAALTGDWGPVFRKVLEAVLKLVGVDPEAFYGFVGRAAETFDIIVNDPLGFLSHLVDALVGGVQGFADRIGEHLKKGIITWLTGTLGGAGITLPQTFDLLGVLDIARQILGLTWERIRAKAVELIGEQNVARLEFIGGYITTLVTEGWSGLWNKLMADLSGLFDTVFDAIKSFLLDRVIMAMIKKIPILFGPVGAIVQLVMTAWNLYEFLRDQLARIATLVTSVVNTIGDIARGVLTVAVAKVEEVLGNFVPVVLDLLAKLLGLGNLSKDLRKVIDSIQDRIDKAIDALIKRVVGLFTGTGPSGAAAGGAPALGDGTTMPTGPPTQETLSIAEEDHTIRSVGPEGGAAVQLASGAFGDLVGRITSVVAGVKRDYTTVGGAKYVGAAQAPKVDSQLDTLVATAETLVADVAKETDKDKEHALIVAGIAALKKLSAALNTMLGLKNPAAASPGTSAPGIGDSVAYGAKPPGNRSGPKIHHTEAEHIIPYKIGDSLLAVIDMSTGSRKKSPKFDKAMLTLVIYEPAAEEKTRADLQVIKRFGTALAGSGIRNLVVGSAQQEQEVTGQIETPGRAAFAELVGKLEEVRHDAADRTKTAIHHDHEAILDGTNMTNGLRRGEKSPVPADDVVEKTSHRQYDELFGLVTSLVQQRGDQPIRPSSPQRNVLESISLADLNVAHESQLSLVVGIGPSRAKAVRDYIETHGPFTSREQVLNVHGIGPATLARITG